MMQPMNN